MPLVLPACIPDWPDPARDKDPVYYRIFGCGQEVRPANPVCCGISAHFCIKNTQIHVCTGYFDALLLIFSR